MYKQSEVIEKLDGFLSYSVIKKPQYASVYGTFIEQMKSTVNKYFTADRSGWKIQLTELQYNLYSDYVKRNTIYEKKNIPLGTDFPQSYYDIRKCFADFSNIMNTTNEVFFNRWIESSDPTTATTTVTGNSLITEWTKDLPTPNKELENIAALCTWIENATNSASVFLLYEDMGKTVKEPTKDEIVKSIFIDRGLKECIDVLSLPTYEPTFI